MKVIEYQDGKCRCVVWELPDAGWPDVEGRLDHFLCDAITAIQAAYGGAFPAWLEINAWPDTGRLMVFPSEEGPFGDRAERVYFELASDYLETAFRRVGEHGPAEERNRAWEALARKVWGRVSACLARGEAAAKLAEAWKSRPVRVAGFDYNAGEGRFRLTDMGPFRVGWTRADVESVLARGDPDELLYVPLVVSLSPPDCSWAEAVCVRLASHPHTAVRANAVLGLGHLARTCRRANEVAVRPVVERALRDESPAVRGKARDAADDLETYLGWTFAGGDGGPK